MPVGSFKGPCMLEITTTSAKDYTVLHVSGRADSATSDDLEEAVKAQLQKGKAQLIFDLSNLDYASSSGLRVFVMAA